MEFVDGPGNPAEGKPTWDHLGSWSSDSIEKIDKYLYKITNLTFTSSPDLPITDVFGNLYLTDYNFYYWHFIHEDLAGYEGVKEKIKDLQLILLDIHDFMEEPFALRSESKHFPYLEFFSKFYEQKDLYRMTGKNYRFESVYYTPTTSSFLYDANFWGELPPPSVWTSQNYRSWERTHWVDNNPYLTNGLNTLTGRLKEAIPVDPETPKKIFISRKDVNSRLRAVKDAPEYAFLVEERLYDSDFLDDYFANKGYQVVALEDLSYEYQMQLFMGATHVAGTAGAGFSNIHMCNQNTKFYEIKVIPIYDFTYEYYAKYRDVIYTPIELRDPNTRETLSEPAMRAILESVDL